MSYDRRRRRLISWACCSLLAACAGCRSETGPPTSPVQGEVTYDGKEIEEGSIVFSPVENTKGGPCGGEIKLGKYRLEADEGPLVGGRYQVEISALRPVGKPLQNLFESDGPPLRSFANYIPRNYNVDSTLLVTISENPADNRFDFKLLPSKSAGPVRR